MDKDQLKSHSYDGIQEYDNQLPRWWMGTFIITVIFGLGYWFYYQTFHGPGLHDEFNKNLADLQQKAQSNAAKTETPFTEEDLKSLMANADEMAASKVTFAAKCSPCHGPDAQGVIGPNLTDDYWLHGNKPHEIFHTIENGVPEKGMVPWKGTLTSEQIRGMVAYVRSFHGSNPPNPKPPQGDKLE